MPAEESELLDVLEDLGAPAIPAEIKRILPAEPPYPPVPGMLKPMIDRSPIGPIIASLKRGMPRPPGPIPPRPRERLEELELEEIPEEELEELKELEELEELKELKEGVPKLEVEVL